MSPVPVPPGRYIRPVTEHQVQTVRGFVYFVSERDIIRRKRNLGLEAPWTDDPILQEYRFCNVRRRDDRVTQWLLKNYFPLFEEDLFFAAAIARLINWPPTLKHLIDIGVLPCSMDTFDRDIFITTLAAYKEEHAKTFTGAYMVFPTNKYAPKEVGLADTLASIIENRKLIEKAMSHKRIESVVYALTQCAGVGTFMGGQFAADLTYLQGQLDTAVDLYKWAPLGPGSQQGMNLMLGFKKGKMWKPEDFNKNLMDVMNDWLVYHLNFEEDNIKMTLHDVQNCFCEYGKYGRTVIGSGRPRSKYKHEGAY